MDRFPSTRRLDAKPTDIETAKCSGLITNPTTVFDKYQKKLYDLFFEKVEKLTETGEYIEALEYGLIYASTQVVRFDWEFEPMEARGIIWPTVYIEFRDQVSQESEMQVLASIAHEAQEVLGDHRPSIAIRRGFNTFPRRQDVPVYYHEHGDVFLTQSLLDKFYLEEAERAHSEAKADRARWKQRPDGLTGRKEKNRHRSVHTGGPNDEPPHGYLLIR
ncbi:hypothetical protein F5X99DRAFT_411199 [Biscogniauxia marginata]|nr:hypothetical protein F5X99DRAFT_411199 [Biscogniauxia marginata]